MVYTVWQPISSGFTVEVDAISENEAIEKVEKFCDGFSNSMNMGIIIKQDIDQQIIENQQPDLIPEIMIDDPNNHN